jgi:chorismate dehydratase
MIIGQTYFKNTDFVYYPLTNGMITADDLSYVRGHPPELGVMLREGSIDIAPVSSIIYGQYFREFCLLPDFSISALGKTMSIILFSDDFDELSEIESKTIAIPGTTATSAALLRIILQLHDINVEFFNHPEPDLDSMLQKADAALLIGDHALKANYAGRRYICDLGEEWMKLTGEKMVYALWVINKQSAIQKPHEIERFYNYLVKSRDKAFKEMDYISARLAEELGVSQSFMKKHLELIDYDLDARSIRGLEVYFEKAFKYGILTEKPELDFFGVAKC